MVAEMKKGRYVYYHCPGYQGSVPDGYTGGGAGSEIRGAAQGDQIQHGSAGLGDCGAAAEPCGREEVSMTKRS